MYYFRGTQAFFEKSGDNEAKTTLCNVLVLEIIAIGAGNISPFCWRSSLEILEI